LNKYTQIAIHVLNINLDDKKLEALNIELKKKEKLAKEPLDPNEMFANSDLSNLDAINVLNDSILSQKKHEDNKSDIQYDLLKLRNRTGYTSEKIDMYRKYMKILDILATILIIFGAFLSQYENELYYYDNIKYRVIGTVLMNAVFRNVTNKTVDSILSNVDFATLINYNVDSNQTASIADMTKDIDWDYINYDQSYTPAEYSNILIYLEISSSCTIIRHIILYTSLGGCNFT
jgi:hypothetical protein